MKKISKRMKSITILTLFLILTAGIFGIIGSGSTAYAADITDIKQPVRAGVFYFEGYHMKDENGGLTGYGVEFLNLVSQYSRINFKYVGYDNSWDDMLDLLEKEKIDVTTSASKTPDREEKFDFSLPIGRRKTVLSIKVNNNDEDGYIRGNYETYNGIRIGLVKGSSQNNLLPEFAKGKFTYTTKEYDDAAQLAAALQIGEDIDAILSSNLRKAENEEELDIIDEADFYAIVRKGDTDLLREINYAIRQMDINEGDWKNELFYKYYGPVYSDALSFNERERAYLNQVLSGDKDIIVTAFGSRAPYSYTENGKLKGILPDYFAEIMDVAAKEMGVQELPYTLKAPANAKDYERLANGGDRVNLVLDRVDYDPIKENEVASCFRTSSYMTVRMAQVTRQNFNGNIRTVALTDSQGIDLVGPYIKNREVLTYATAEEALTAVMNSDADVAYVYSYTAQYFINHGHADKLSYSSINGMVSQIFMHIIPNTDHELLTILNKCIKQIPDDTLNQLALNYTIDTDDMDFGAYIRKHPEIIIGIVLVIVVIISLIITLYLRERWSKKLLSNTQQSSQKMGEHLAIVAALSRDYTNVFTIDEAEATARIIKLDSEITKKLKRYSENDIKEYEYSSVIETYIRHRVHPDDKQELANLLSLENVSDKLYEDTSYTGNFRVIDSDESVHYLQFTFMRITDSRYGYGTYILAGFRNIDEMISKEKEQNDKLAETLALVQDASKAKTEFLRSMSHDIRTPMNAIIEFTDSAMQHVDDKAQIIDDLDNIKTSGNHLFSIINSILDLSQIESGNVKIEETEVSLPEVLRDLKTVVQADVKSKQLEFSVDTPDLVNETVFCDKFHLNQVLLNVLGNAIKYTNQGGSVNVCVVESPAERKGYANFNFNVKDTGIGMSPEFLEHVFEPFEREQTPTVSGTQGSGLGLPITKKLVDMMNGTISIDSKLGVGSEVSIKFCFKVADTPSEQKDTAETDPADMRAGENKMPHADNKW